MALRDFVPEPLLAIRRSMIRAQRLKEADAESRIIEVEYPYDPKPRDIASSAGGRILRELLGKRDAAMEELIRTVATYRPEFEKIAITSDPAGVDPFWINGWLGGLDSATIYGLLVTRNPTVYLEVGSGNSTKFARQAIRNHGLKTRIVSIDPAPRAGIDTLCDEVIRAPFETVPMEKIAPHLNDAMIFIDNSHRSFMNSDVTVFFSDMLPAIPAGSLWGLHDIFLPADYPAGWTNRFYNEQYLLMTYLLGGGGKDKIVMANAYAGAHPELSKIIATDLFSGAHLSQVEKSGGCLWLERG